MNPRSNATRLVLKRYRPRCAPCSDSPVSGPGSPPRGTRRCRPARRGWPARRARTCTRWTARPPRSAGTGARLRAQEIASTPTGHTPGSRASPPKRWAQFWFILTPVRRRPPRPDQRRSRTREAAGGRRSAALESVLGATPREFESRILRRPDLQEHPLRPLAGRAFTHTSAHLMGSFPGRGGAAADLTRCGCAWSEASRTGLDGGAHAVEACAPRNC